MAMTVFTTNSGICPKFSVRVRGEFVNVSFIPSVLFGVVGASTFVTRDQDLADAIKAHRYFGTYIFVKSETAETPKPSEDAKIKTLEEELSDPTSPIIVESVTNRAMAIAYIQGTYEESFTSTSNEDMRREAARRWNILFPKWTR